MTTLYSRTLPDDQTLAAFTLRNLCLGSGPSLGQLRATFQAGPAGLSCDHCSIGVSNGTVADCTAVPVELTFGGGHGFNIAGNATIVSDWVTLAASGTPTFVVVMDTSASGNTDVAKVNPGGATLCYFDISEAGGWPSYNLQNGGNGGSWGSTSSTYGVNLIETQ